MTIVAASGFFDPLHIGHLEYLQLSKSLGDKLIVMINSDEDAIRKKGFVFLPFIERVNIIKALRCVDEVFEVVDTDGSVAKTLSILKPDIFAKGGDRDLNNMPIKEIDVCQEYGIQIVSGLGSKIESSSYLVKKAIDAIQSNEKGD